MTQSRSWFGIVLILSVAACSGGSKRLQLGGTCTLNTDCKDPLVCKFGACHAGCTQSRDCASGERCVLVDNIGVCQQTTEAACAAYAPRCKTPLVCAADNLCRNSCTVLGDCMRGQECVSGLCLESSEATTWRADGGVGPDGGAPITGTDARALQPDTAITAPDTPAATGLDTNSAGVDAPAGNTDGSRTGGDGSATVVDGGSLTPPDLQPTKWETGPSPTDATVAATAVASPTSVRPGEEITLKVGGVGIGNPRSLTLGGVLADNVVISDATDVSFTAKLSVPHGITPGVVDLGFSCASGQARAPEVVQITPIAVSLSGLDTNRGTPDNPFRTFTKAVMTAGTGDAITVGGGEFSQAESWPAIPHKATVQGAGASNTIFKHNGGTISFAGDATVADIGVDGFCTIAISIQRSSVILRNIATVRMGDCSYAGDVDVASGATGVSLTVEGPQTSLPGGIYAYGTNLVLNIHGGQMGHVETFKNGAGGGATGAKILVEDAMLGTAATGVTVVRTAAADVTLNRATLNGQVVLATQSSFTATDSSFHFTSGSVGITSSVSNYTYTDGQRGSAEGSIKATLTNCTLDGGAVQLQVAKSDTVFVRQTKFLNYDSRGVSVVGVFAQCDLGNDTEAGGNTFTGSKASGIYALADDSTSATNNITVSGTSFNGVIPPAGKLSQVATAPVNVAGAYFIKTEGNSITFY